MAFKQDAKKANLNVEKERVYLVDASIYFFRYYFSMPDNWWSHDGYPSSAAYGYTLWLIRFLKLVKPNFVAACFDESLGSCFRNDIYPDYKASRAPPDEGLAFQLQVSRELSEMLGLPCYASETYEADDLIGTLSKHCQDEGRPVTILSRDKDLGQLIQGDDDLLWDCPQGEKLGALEIKDKMGVDPLFIPDMLALTGDASDDIPGVPGIGIKTASIIVNHLGGWGSIKKNFTAIESLPIRSAKKVASKLAEYEPQISMALRLTEIVRDIPFKSFSLNRTKKIDVEQISAFGEVLGFAKGFRKNVEALVDMSES